MDVIHLVIILAVLGFALWLLLTYVPMPAPFKTVIIAIVALALIIAVLDFAGIGSYRIGHI